MNSRPLEEEYDIPFEQYVRLVPEGDILDILAKLLQQTSDLFSTLTDDQANNRYAPGKWSLKEVLGHITDNERIMSYRILRIARGDRTPLTGYDQDVLMSGADFDSIALPDIVEEYKAVRQGTLYLLRALTDEAWSRRGIVNDRESSVRAWAYIIAGHELHHLNVAREKYLHLP